MHRVVAKQVGRGPVNKEDVAKERARQKAIVANYEWTVAHAESESWAKLEVAPPPEAYSAQILNVLFAKDSRPVTEVGVPDASTALVTVPAATSHKQTRFATFWQNYDITQSLGPTLIPPDKYKAAKSIAQLLRMYLARRVRERKKFEQERLILRREAVKLQSVWRRHYAIRRFDEVKDRVNKQQREQRAYDNFRTTLLGSGYRVLRYSHKKKQPVPCTVKVDKKRLFFLFQQNALKSKRYSIQDIKGVTKGYQSTFLKDNIPPREPDKHLSIYFRDPTKTGASKSVDLLFDSLDSRRQHDKDGAGGSGDGKNRRNKFFLNFVKLQHELESDDAFFFDNDGVYCRVSKSVFVRWERVRMVDPMWTGSETEDQRRGHHDRRTRLLKQQQATRTHHKGCWRPLPLAPRDKPQAGGPDGVISVIYACEPFLSEQQQQQQQQDAGEASLGLAYAATWFSRTISIDYGKSAEHLSKSKYFDNPMKKEEFILQRCVRKPGSDTFHPQFAKSRARRRRRSSGAAEVPSSSSSSSLGGGGAHVDAAAGAHALRHKSTHAVSDHGSAEAAAPPPLEPVRARLDEMKPYFEEEIKTIFGDIGVVGWRNNATGEFEFEEAEWRALIRIARTVTFNKTAKKAADMLEDAMNEDVQIKRGQRPSLHTGGGGGEDADDGGTRSPRQQRSSTALPSRDLIPLRKNLLANMWKVKDQRKGRMWRSSEVTYNTAQKNKLIAERRRAEKAALEERERHEADKRAAALAYESGFSSIDAFKSSETHAAASARSLEQHGAAASPDASSSSPSTHHDGLTPATPEPPVQQQQQQQQPRRQASPPSASPRATEARLISTDEHCRDGRKIELAVLETASRRQRSVPLGIKVAKLDLRDSPMLLRGKKRDVRISCKCALVVHSVSDEALPSIFHAWQNQILKQRDLIISLNGKSPDRPEDLVQLAQQWRKPRAITIFRLTARAQDQQDDDGRLISSLLQSAADLVDI